MVHCTVLDEVQNGLLIKYIYYMYNIQGTYTLHPRDKCLFYEPLGAGEGLAFCWLLNVVVLLTNISDP